MLPYLKTKLPAILYRNLGKGYTKAVLVGIEQDVIKYMRKEFYKLLHVQYVKWFLEGLQ